MWAIVDYKMPRMGNFADTHNRPLKLGSPETRVIVLSGFSNTDIALQAARGGASGYLLKSTRLDSVIAAIRTVAADGIWVDPISAQEGLPRFPTRISIDQPSVCQDGLIDSPRAGSPNLRRRR